MSTSICYPISGEIKARRTRLHNEKESLQPALPTLWCALHGG